MKQFSLFAILAALLFACAGPKKTGTTAYQVISDTETKVLKGVLSRAVLENDTAFGWFKEGMRFGSADAYAVEQFQKNKAKFSILVFAGTWCHDSQNLLPKFYRLLDKSGYPEKKVTLVGMDRAKTALNDLHIKWKITNVPTFLILVKGKETGRVVEYGTSGNMEHELAEIVSRL